MKLNTSYVQKCKTVAHVFQLLLAFVAACITIAVFTQDGTTGGATKFYFALCFLTIPAVIYLVMVPMWSRAERFANAYAFAAVDALYTILWFAAFIAVTAYNTTGVEQGAEEKKLPTANCTTFKFGSEKKCELSRTTVGFGVIIFIAFALTAAISGYYVHAFRKEGRMPYESNKTSAHYTTGDLNKDSAWSAEMDHPHGQHSDEEDRHTDHGGDQHDDEYALLHGTETDDGRHPGRPLSWGKDHHSGGDAEMHGHGSEGPVQPPYAAHEDNHNALSPGGYEDYRKDAHAPSGAGQGPVGSGGSGYSFSR